MRVIIMNEPTAALGVRETAKVLALIRRLKETGHTILLISHYMADVVAVADRVVILTSGRKVADRPVAGLEAADLARLVMTGGGASAPPGGGGGTGVAETAHSQ